MWKVVLQDVDLARGVWVAGHDDETAETVNAFRQAGTNEPESLTLTGQEQTDVLGEMSGGVTETKNIIGF